MLNSLRDGQINYGTTNCPSVHVPPHNVVTPIHQNSLHSTEPSTPVVYPWNSNPRLEHLYGFHSRYYNLDFPSPYPPATNQYVSANIYGQNVTQCCQPCCRLRSQNIPKPSPPQVLYNPIRPEQQLNRSYKSKKTLKTPCSEQFLPCITNDLQGKYDTQNCYQQKYGSSYLNNTNYCPPANNLWIPPATNPTWSVDRLRPVGRHTSVTPHDFSREKSYQRLQHYQTNSYSNPSSSTHHRPYNYIPPIPDVQNYRPSAYHNPIKNNTSEYVSQEHSSRLPISSQINQSPTSLQQYYNAQPVSYSDSQRPCEPFKPSQVTPQNSSKSNLNVREFLATWDEGEEEICEKSSETTTPIVVLDCMTLEGDALTKIQEKLNVVSYENLEKVLKENNNPIVINTESSEIDSINNKVKPLSKPNFEPIDYTKRETGIIKPFITEKKQSPTTNTQCDKNYSVNFDGMVAWYGKKNTDISSTDLIERLADRIFNLSKSQENDGVSFGTAAYTGQITQTNRSIASSVKDSSKYLQSQHMYGLQYNAEKCFEPSVINKNDCNNDSISRIHSGILNESKKASTTKPNHINSSCIVENINKKCLNVTNEEAVPWTLDQGTQEQHLNMSLYDHTVINKPLDFSSLTDETKCNPFVFEKNTSSGNKSNNNININDPFNKVLNENNNYNEAVSNNQQIDSTNRNFPVIVSPHAHRQDYNGSHESVIQRTGCNKNKHDKISTQTDFESMNWTIPNDIDKIMKNTNMSMEPPCLYDRNNYNMLDSMNSDKNVSTQWKDNVPCVDLTVNSKTNNNHDSFFDSWNFIESYENHSSKKLINSHSSSNEIHNDLFSNQINSLEESNNKQNSSEKIENETLIPIKDISNDVSSNNARPQDVFNLNNRIPDFSDGFELPVIHESHDYLQFKKTSNDNERRTDGSIFEHLSETKCVRTVNEMPNTKNDQNKSDIVGLPSFKEKEPLAPMLVPPKLNIVKPILRDPSQLYTVIKQKPKYDNTCIDNDSAVLNKTVNNLRENHPINFNVDDLKSKYNSVQLNQFDVWSEKFELKSNSNNSSSAVVHCDIEITQFKCTPENRNALIPKPNIRENYENYQDKNEKLPENTNSNLTMNKMNVIENEKNSSNDFFNCLENTKTDDQKYRDTLDEFETSFGFDIHCNNESNKSFHEDIVDKCLEERIKDQIGEHSITSSDSNITLNTNISSDSSRLPFQCDFQSGYLIKNYFDENKNKTNVFDRKQKRNDEKSSETPFNYHNEIGHNFEIQNNTNSHGPQNSEKNSDFNIVNNIDCDTGQIKNYNDKNNSNFINHSEFNSSFEPNRKNSNTNNLPSTDKSNEDYLTVDNQNYKFENDKKKMLELADSKEFIGNNKLTDNNDVCKINQSDSNIHKVSNIRKNFELNINDSNIFETNSSITNRESENEIIKNLEFQNIDNNFEPRTSVNIKQHNFNTKDIYGIENNNCTIYQTQNLEKMNQFDFETRIIHNFEMECSSSDVLDSTNSKEVFTCENQMKSKYSLEVNNGNNLQKETHFKNTPNTYETHIPKTSDVDCNDITQLDNVIETKNINPESKIDNTFDIDCDVDNVQRKKTSEVHKHFDVQIKNVEVINLDNCCTHENSNLNNNTEVENILKNLYGNISTLNTKEVESNISDQCDRNLNEFDVSKSQDYVEDQNLKTNESEIIVEDCEKTKIDECHNEKEETFEETNTICFEKFENNSTSNFTSALLKNELTSEERDSKELNKHASNNNNDLDISLTNVTHENTKTYEEQQSHDFQRDKIELINQNNMQTIKNMTVDIVQDNTMKEIIENIKSDLLNAVQNTDVQHDNEQNRNLNYGSCPINLAELSNRQYCNQTVEVQDSTNSRSNSLNLDQLTCKQKPKIVEIENPTNFKSSFLNHADLTCLQNSNDIEIKNTANSISNLLYDTELALQNSDQIVESKASDRFESSLINSAEIARQQNSYNLEHAASFKSNTTNHVELDCQQNSTNNIAIKDTASSETNLSNQAEIVCQQDSNDIVDVKLVASSEVSSSYHSELTCHQNAKNNSYTQDSASPESSLSNNNELYFQRNLNNSVEVEDLSSSELSSSNLAKFTDKHNLNDSVEVTDVSSSENNLSSHAELACRQNLNYKDEVQNSAHPEIIPSNHTELTYQQNVDCIADIENLSRSESTSSFKHIESSFQKHSGNTAKVEDLTDIRSSPSHKTKSTCRQHPYKSIEVKISSSCKPSLLNHIEIINQPHSNEISGVEDTMDSQNIYHAQRSVSNDNGLTCQQNSDDNVIVENLTDKKSSILFENSIQLPRVKFILKCHRKNMINTNIFDEESTVPLKKCNLLKDEKFIARHIYKKSDKFYKPWRSIYSKKSVVELKENIKELETVGPQTINVDNTSQSFESQDFNDRKQKNEEICPVKSPYSNVKQSTEKSNHFENKEICINTSDNIADGAISLLELNTPMPSPFDDFQSENLSPEHYVCEEYWDKSLENEYNNVLHKTISKLTKIRVNIRDKFDIRLLARRTNIAKQRKWRRWCRQQRRLDEVKFINDNVSDYVVGNIKIPTEVLTLNSTTVKTTINPICKIKVQLPWGRIFNLNNSGVEDNQKTKDNKLELGPAKVEVRLSQTPGEWQVAACEPMTSSKSVVSVRRLILQRASPTKDDYSDNCDTPSKDCDSELNSSDNFDGGCDSSAKSYNDADKNPKNSYNDCNSSEKDYDDCLHNSKEDFDNNCTTASRSSKDDSYYFDSNSSSSKDESDLNENSRKLPKIVIRRIGQDNNYTSYVSNSGFEGDDKNDGTRQLMVRIVRDRKLDAMAVEGITTVHLKHNVPISESAADTHDAKRVRYT